MYIKVNEFNKGGSKCLKSQKLLLTSFSKRIGYLHDDENAVAIAKQWISPNGILHNIKELKANVKERNDVGA